MAVQIGPMYDMAQFYKIQCPYRVSTLSAPAHRETALFQYRHRDKCVIVNILGSDLRKRTQPVNDLIVGRIYRKHKTKESCWVWGVSRLTGHRPIARATRDQ